MNTIKLDGKSNIFDDMYKDLPDNNSQGKLSEKEKNDIINRVNNKVTHEWDNNPVLMIKGGRETDYNSELEKSVKDTAKLIKKVIVNKKGIQQTVYIKPMQVKGMFNSIISFFKFKDERQARDKVAGDYSNYKIKNKFGISLESYGQHLNEYFLNKSKWDSFFTGKKKDTKKNEAKPAEKKEKPEQLKKKTSVKLAVMKFIHSTYGQQSQPATAPIEAKVESEQVENNFESMPEKETSEQEKDDTKISKAINTATPETRYEKEREIMGIPEPENKEEIETVIIEFKPEYTNIEIPFFKNGNSQMIIVQDFTKVRPKDIYLISDKKIENTPKPSYIPNVDPEYFKYTNNMVIAYKLDNDKYIIKTNGKQWDYDKGSKGEDLYAIVNRDVLAATQDYFLKLSKVNYKKQVAEYKVKYGLHSRIKPKAVRMSPDNKMTVNQADHIQDFIGHFPRYDREKSKVMWNMYQEIHADLKQKIEDMEIQLEEYYNTHAKGRETSYGDKGTKDNLLKDYGVKVKRQNGAEIDEIEISEIKSAMDDLFSVFGNRSSMARNFGLKISHSGKKAMHARKAVGIFMPSMKAIGVGTQYGSTGTGFILAHEWGHFMDYYLGLKSDRHYVSDNPKHIAGEIADLFRKNMGTEQNSVYQNRTCECFARAMEQYWCIKTNNEDYFAQWDMSLNHPTMSVFKERIMPLIDKLLSENEPLLKAIFRNRIFKIRKPS